MSLISNEKIEAPTSYDTVWQKSAPTVAWGTVLLFIGCVSGYYFTITSTLNGSLPYWAACLLCVYLAFASFTVLHDAGHGSIIKEGSPLKPLESVMGWIASIPLMTMPFRFFQKIHDRHHAFTNDPERDPDHFASNESGTWYQVVLNSFYVTFRYHVLAFTKLRNIETINNTYKSTFGYAAIHISVLATLTYFGYGLEVLTIAILPVAIAAFLLVMLFDYLPHYPHSSLDRYHDTRIYPGRLLNLLLLGQNYHLIHHMYPKLPWYKYSEVYRNILPDLEAHDAPIEDIGKGIRPGFLRSPNAMNLLKNGTEVNHVLEVAQVEKLTSDATAVTFDLPSFTNDNGEQQKDVLNFRAGQYITVSKWLNGEHQTRCYSLCTSPQTSAETGQLTVGIRHTPNGLVSGYMNESLKTGDEIVVKGPFGDFMYPPLNAAFVDCNTNVRDDHQLVLVAGGSGITPILSILHTALEQENPSQIHLLYTGRNLESMMFSDQIMLLKEKYAGRLNVSYILEQVDSESEHLSGRLNQTLLSELLPMLGENTQDASDVSTEFYLCGPEGLKNVVVDSLALAGVAAEKTHAEEFVSTAPTPVGRQHQVDISLANGKKHTLRVASNQTVLEVANAEGICIPHACGNGVCGSCKLSVVAGNVGEIPTSAPGIASSDIDCGFTLSCQCRPLSDISLCERH